MSAPSRHLTLVGALALCALGSASRVFAQPAAWPDDASACAPGSRWIAYTVEGRPILDPATSSNGGPGDPSSGANPTGAQDISSGVPDGSSPSAYWSFDPAQSVLFYRIRVAQDPMATGVARDGIADPTSADIAGKPWSNGAWNLTIDVDGDGFKEFALLIDGNSGGGAQDVTTGGSAFPAPPGVVPHAGDDILVMHGDVNSQLSASHEVTAGVVTGAGDVVWIGEAATRAVAGHGLGGSVPPPNGFQWDFGATRCVYYENDPCWGTGWMVDAQVPMSALRGSWSPDARSLVTARTPIQFAYSTANSNTDPFQKDVALAGNLVASPDARHAFGDVVTTCCGTRDLPLGAGPFIDAETCGTEVLLRVPVVDALRPNPANAPGANANPPVVDTIASVAIDLQRDLRCAGIEDPSAPWLPLQAVAGSANPDTDGLVDADGSSDPASIFNAWGVRGDVSSLADGCWLYRLGATDDTGNVFRRIGLLHLIDRVSGCSTMSRARISSYADPQRRQPRNEFVARDGEVAYYGGDGFVDVADFVIAHYGPSGELVRVEQRMSDALGSLDAELPLDGTSPTGTWHAVVFPSDAVVPSLRDPGNPDAIAVDSIVVSSANDSDGDGLADATEVAVATNPLDADTDDDGMLDGADGISDVDLDGRIDALDPDSDNDGLPDGLEVGIVTPHPSTDVSLGWFRPDLDPSTTTDPDDPDTDDGGVIDGAEDRTGLGRVDAGERDPTPGHGGDDRFNGCAVGPLFEVDGRPRNGLRVTRSGEDVVIDWTDEVSLRGEDCIVYDVHVATTTPSSRSAFTQVTTTAADEFAWRRRVGDSVLDFYLVVARSLAGGEGSWGFANDGTNLIPR